MRCEPKEGEPGAGVLSALDMGTDEFGVGPIVDRERDIFALAGDRGDRSGGDR